VVLNRVFESIQRIALGPRLGWVHLLLHAAPGAAQLLPEIQRQGFAAGPVYGRAKCLRMLGEIKT